MDHRAKAKPNLANNAKPSTRPDRPTKPKPNQADQTAPNFAPARANPLKVSQFIKKWTRFLENYTRFLEIWATGPKPSQTWQTKPNRAPLPDRPTKPKPNQAYQTGPNFASRFGKTIKSEQAHRKLDPVHGKLCPVPRNFNHRAKAKPNLANQAKPGTPARPAHQAKAKEGGRFGFRAFGLGSLVQPNGWVRPCEGLALGLGFK